MRPILSQLCLALAVGGLALTANAQQTGNAAAGNAPAAQSTAGSSGAMANAPAHGKKSAMKQHAMKHRSATRGSREGRRESRAQMASEMNGPDSAYKAALRRCVTGPQSSREACLDQAISQYGHA